MKTSGTVRPVRDKRRESSAENQPPTRQERGIFPEHRSRVEGNVAVRASLEEIQAIGPERAKAFLEGIAAVIATTTSNPDVRQVPIPSGQSSEHKS